MPVHREKAVPSEREKKHVSVRDPSNARRVKREDSEDRRPIVTQSKPKSEKVRKEATTSKEKTKPPVEKTKPPVAKTKPPVERKKTIDRERTIVKAGRSAADSVSKTKVKDITTLKDFSGRKLVKESSLDARTKKLSRPKEKEPVVKNKKDKVEETKETTKEKMRESRKSSKKNRERTRTHTLSPTEVKVLHLSRLADVGPDELDNTDQYLKAFGKWKEAHQGGGDEGGNSFEDKTAEEAAAGPQGDDDDDDEEEEEEEEENYEDDFEDYESDFEEDSESAGNKSDEEKENREENDQEIEREYLVPVETQDFGPTSFNSHERRSSKFKLDEMIMGEKMDSGSYDLKIGFQKKEIEEMKLALQKEQLQVEARRNGTVLPDEGYSEETNTKTAENVPQLINFSNARKRRLEQKVAAKAKKRGEDLLSMITLDCITYSLLEIPATPYEVYMKTYGRSNTFQVHVQTNEDDLDEETQTDAIVASNKWTQKPVQFVSVNKEGEKAVYMPLKEERLGVGGDFPIFTESTNSIINTNRLNEFLVSAGQMILASLEYGKGNTLSKEKMANNSGKISFGDGYLSLSVSNIPFLRDRSVSNLSFSKKNSSRVLTVHQVSSDHRCMICVWSVQEPSKPLKILLSSGQATCCCFGPDQGNLVFAGLADGSVCLWDLREPSICHEGTVESDWVLRSPTYCTAEILKDQGHQSPVVSVVVLTSPEDMPSHQDFTPIQICSLEESGTIVIWTVTQYRNSKRNAPNDDLGLAHWGKVKLVKSSSFSLFDHLREEISGMHITCNDLAINDAEETGLFVASSLGRVHHVSTYGSSMKPKFYANNKQDAFVETTCLEMCPFDTNYFLVGCGDGSIRLHNRHQESPLICLNGNVIENGPEASILSLVWLHTRPCVFFALDSLSRIHVWDLGVSDMYPEVSLVLTKKKITCMKLNSIDKRQSPCIVLTTALGEIEIHRLNQDYGSRTQQDINKEMKMFLRYVSIL